MQNVILTIHMIIALMLIGVVLLQRSEGGGLGMGSNAGIQGRAQGSALTRLTWILAGAFLVTSLTLTMMSGRNSGGDSVLERLVNGAPATEDPATPLPADLTGDLTPGALTSGPAAPPAAEPVAPAT